MLAGAGKLSTAKIANRCNVTETAQLEDFMVKAGLAFKKALII